MEKMHFTMHLVAMRKCCILRGALILGPWMFNTFQIIHDLFLNMPAHTTFLNQSSQKLQIHVWNNSLCQQAMIGMAWSTYTYTTVWNASSWRRGEHQVKKGWIQKGYEQVRERKKERVGFNKAKETKEDVPRQ